MRNASQVRHAMNVLELVISCVSEQSQTFAGRRSYLALPPTPAVALEQRQIALECIVLRRQPLVAHYNVANFHSVWRLFSHAGSERRSRTVALSTLQPLSPHLILSGGTNSEAP